MHLWTKARSGAGGLVTGLLLALPTLAGHTIDITLLDRTADKPQMTRTAVLVGPDGFLMDTTALQGRSGSILCRRDESLYLLDHSTRRYAPLNLSVLSGASALARQAGRLLQGEAGTSASPAGGSTLSTQATDQRKDFAGLPCRLYVVKRGGTTLQEIWMTPWASVALPESSYALIRQVAASWTAIAPLVQAGGEVMPDIPLDGLLAAEGYPVLFRQFANGRPVYEARFGAPKPTPTPPTAFTVPPAYAPGLPLGTP